MEKSFIEVLKYDHLDSLTIRFRPDMHSMKDEKQLHIIMETIIFLRDIAHAIKKDIKTMKRYDRKHK